MQNHAKDKNIKKYFCFQVFGFFLAVFLKYESVCLLSFNQIPLGFKFLLLTN
jgi:hypothetical protein